MASDREQIIQAVVALVTAAAPSAVVERNTEMPLRPGGGALIIVRDGDVGDPEITLSPLTYTYGHAIRVEALVEAPGDTRFAVLDNLLTPIGAAIEADRTLGGLANWVEPTPPDSDDAVAPNAQPLRWAAFDIVANYTTFSPL